MSNTITAAKSVAVKLPYKTSINDEMYKKPEQSEA